MAEDVVGDVGALLAAADIVVEVRIKLPLAINVLERALELCNQDEVVVMLLTNRRLGAGATWASWRAVTRRGSVTHPSRARSGVLFLQPLGLSKRSCLRGRL